MTQFKPWLHAFAAVLFLSGLLLSCKKSVFDETELADHAAEYAFPLFKTTLNIKDLMNQVLNDTLAGDTIQVNADGTMTLFYSGDVAEKPASTLLPPTGIVQVVDTNALAPIAAPAGVTIRKVDLKGTTLQLAIKNNTTDTIKGTFYVPQMVKNGVVFSLPFVVAPQPPSFPLPWLSAVIDVTGYELTSNNNTLQFRYEAYDESGTRIKIPEAAPGVAGMGVLFNNLAFSYLEGYWGYTEYELVRDTIDIDINQTSLSGNVKVVNPKVTMTVYNSWGFPTRGVVKYLAFVAKDGHTIDLESSIFNNDSVDFNYPSWAAGEVGQTKFTYFTLDNTNSNIETIFNSQPTQLIYDVAGISNATHDTSIIGFVTDSSVIGLSMRVELLLEGTAQNFGAQQVLNLNFGENSKIDTANIESVEFKLVTENGTPINNNVQLYFQDSTGVAIDSLFDGGSRDVMQAAPVGPDGIVTSVKRTETYVPMSIERFDRIRQAKTAYLKLAFSTYTAPDGTQQPVKLLANMNVTFKMGLKLRTRN